MPIESELTSLAELVSVTEPAELVTARDVPVTDPVWVRFPPELSVIAEPWMPAVAISKPVASE